MAKKILLLIVSILWLVPMVGEKGSRALADEVVRLVPVDGAEQDVPVDALRKIVFTKDSIVFVRKALDSDVPDAVYKYDYSAMLFVPAESQSIESTSAPESCESVKFIQDGRLYIRRDNKIYDVLGTPIQ